MRITLTDAGKRFNRDWIFRHFHYEFIAGRSYAITGPNGSGKSTLLQVIAGALTISEGTVRYDAVQDRMRGRMQSNAPAPAPALNTPAPASALKPSAPIPPDQVFRHISLAAPYLEVIEEMTLVEFLRFHEAFKAFLPGFTPAGIATRVGLEAAMNKQIRYFSSGMKQRVKLAQAIFSDTAVVLLDEPCTNLDADGIALYRQLVTELCAQRLLIVSSNDRQEYEFCGEIIDISGYKALTTAKPVL